MTTVTAWLSVSATGKRTFYLGADSQGTSLQTGQAVSLREKKVFERDPEEDRRRFLHFLSVLQREGRLLDFFSEDLSIYEDEQIGAAVRGIHENCKKTMKKYLDPVPVTDLEEGSEMVVEEGFDPDIIKLVGNVTGNPPFKGVVRHRGWKASKTAMPELSKVRDASVMAPVEIEIQ